jgi:hypothetical protein
MVTAERIPFAVGVQLSRARALSQHVEEWQKSLVVEEIGRDVPDLVREALRSAEDLHRMVERVGELLADESAEIDTEAVGRALLAACDLTALALRSAAFVVEQARRRGLSTAEAGDELRAAEVALAERRRRVEANWPWVDWAALDEAQAAVRRGESQDAEDSLRELQSEDHSAREPGAAGTGLQPG